MDDTSAEFVLALHAEVIDAVVLAVVFFHELHHGVVVIPVDHFEPTRRMRHS